MRHFWSWIGLMMVAGCMSTVLAAESNSNDATRMPFRIDGARSHIEFRVQILGMVPMQGRIEGMDVQLLPVAASARWQVRVIADAVRLQMKDERRTRWARSEEFFDVARHPHIIFESEPVALPELLKGGTLKGQLQLRGVTRPVTATLEPSACKAIASETECRVQAHGMVSRSAFGMKARRWVVNDKVRFELDWRMLTQDRVP